MKRIRQIWESKRNPFRARHRSFIIVDKPNAYGITNSQLRGLIEKRGKEATRVLNETFGSVNELVKRLGSDEKHGLSSDPEVLRNQRECFGENVIPPTPAKTLLSLCWAALVEPLMLLLLACAAVSIGLSFYHPPETVGSSDSKYEWIEGVAIFTAVMIVVLVGGINDWQKDKQFRGLQDKIEGDKFVVVLRDGKLQQINKADLVVGDIYSFKYGDLLQADGFLVQGNDVLMDESSLTGESDLIKKNDENRTMLSGTNVMEGNGRMVVTGVGMNSQIGVILRLLDSEANEDHSSDTQGSNTTTTEKTVKKESKNLTVLQLKLSKLAFVITKAGVAAAIITFICLILRFAITTYVINKQKWSNQHISYLVHSLVQAITVVVVAVPEGLPLAVTLALAFAVKRMLKDNNLVRHLNACETMGNATTICSDKTGTLTTNRMSVTQCYISGKYYKNAIEAQRTSPGLLDLISESISVNTSYGSMLKPSTVPGEQVGQIGNKTECGLLSFVVAMDRNYEAIRKQHPEMTFHKVFTFNSARKMMTTVVKKSSGYFVYTKGASEMVLSRCNWLMRTESKKEAINDKTRNAIMDAIEKMAGDALRTICVAYRVISVDKGLEIDWDDEDEVVQDMTCLCITGIQDPVRDEVPESIRRCQNAGVVVRMVTGDNVNTARSIATQCGIIYPGSKFLVLESSEFNERIRDKNGKIDQKLLDEVWPNLRVLARSSPQDKYNLVKGIVESRISSHREIVAVTGDGTNDAPALKRADVGFAMGIQGTDVAKEACDIILTDDNFTSIVKALMWGRNVYDNIAKFLQFQLTANVTAGVLSVVCAAAISRVPLSALQMLWVNLVMDTLASVALASEKPTEELLLRKPYGRTKFIISPIMMRNILGHSVYQLTVLFVILFAGPSFLDTDSMVEAIKNDPTIKYPSQHFTAMFNAFVLMTLFNEINSRKLHGERNVFKGVFSNWIFVSVWIACVILQVVIVFFGGLAFSVSKLTLNQWVWCLFFGIGSLIYGQLLSLMPMKPFIAVAKRVSKTVNLKKRKKKEGEDNILTPLGEGFDESLSEFDLDEPAITDSAVLWYRGINRVRVQAHAVELFRKKLL